MPHSLHAGIDGWTSLNVISVLGITIQFYDNGKLNSFILDCIMYMFFALNLQLMTDLPSIIFSLKCRHTSVKFLFLFFSPHLFSVGVRSYG